MAIKGISHKQLRSVILALAPTPNAPGEMGSPIHLVCIDFGDSDEVEIYDNGLALIITAHTLDFGSVRTTSKALGLTSLQQQQLTTAQRAKTGVITFTARMNPTALEIVSITPIMLM